MARSFGPARADSYGHFYRALYAQNEHDCNLHWESLVETIPDEMKEYMTENWYESRESWALCFRKGHRL